jgi:hypothetical protein
VGRLRLTPATRARLVTIAGGLTAAAGTYLLWGLGVALLAAGVGVVAYGLLGIDVDRKGR